MISSPPHKNPNHCSESNKHPFETPWPGFGLRANVWWPCFWNATNYVAVSASLARPELSAPPRSKAVWGGSWGSSLQMIDFKLNRKLEWDFFSWIIFCSSQFGDQPIFFGGQNWASRAFVLEDEAWTNPYQHTLALNQLVSVKKSRRRGRFFFFLLATGFEVLSGRHDRRISDESYSGVSGK